MSQTLHLSLSVRGALDWPKRRLRGMLRDESGRTLSPDEARAALMDELSRGVEYLPIGACDDFDPKSGCRGHAAPAEGGR